LFFEINFTECNPKCYICNNIAIILILTKRYKIFIGAFLMALYFFIVPPAGLWHQHGHPPAFLISHSTENDVVSTSLETVTQGNCEICSHHFSVYIEDIEILPTTATFLFSSKVKYSTPSILRNTIFSLTSRGPPTKA